MNLAGRLQGAYFSPAPTFKTIAERPKWVDALIIVLIFVAVAAYLTAPVASQDSLKAMKDNPKLQEKMGQERYDKMIQNMEAGQTSGAQVRAAAFGSVLFIIGLFISALVILVMGRLVSTEGAFMPIVAVLVHANFVDKILGGIVRTALVLARQSVFQTSTSLAILAPKIEFTSVPYIVLGQFDFFQIWMFGLVGYGLAALFKVT
ncbi:MAG: YIP1 family protein, partial [Candidatus Aminicenantales bacterium]